MGGGAIFWEPLFFFSSSSQGAHPSLTGLFLRAGAHFQLTLPPNKISSQKKRHIKIPIINQLTGRKRRRPTFSTAYNRRSQALDDTDRSDLRQVYEKIFDALEAQLLAIIPLLISVLTLVLKKKTNMYEASTRQRCVLCLIGWF